MSWKFLIGHSIFVQACLRKRQQQNLDENAPGDGAWGVLGCVEAKICPNHSPLHTVSKLEISDRVFENVYT
ncbi:hypothetical protein Hanom_Chr06g00497061 [Helianthus anomalus]